MTSNGQSEAPATGSEQARLAAFGQVAGELMHDLANLVAILRTRTILALGDAREGRIPLDELERVVENSEEMGAMLRDAMEVLKGATPSPDTVFDPRATVERVVRRFADEGPPLQLHLDSELPAGTLVRGRASFLARAVMNLLVNAARHARNETRISLRVARGAEERLVSVMIEDDGPGIPPERVEAAFRPLVRGTRGETGLGLSSVAWSVANLNGEIRYHTDTTLGGAGFEVLLPLAEGGRITTPAAPKAGKSLAGRRLLLVEDDVIVRGVLIRLLERLGAEPIAFSPRSMNEEDLLQEILRSVPDAILMDLKLGRYRGVAIWRMLRAHVPGLARQVIFLSGLGAGDPDWEAAHETGQRILGKPIDLGELADAVKEVTTRD